MALLDADIRLAVERLVEDLAAGNFKELERDGRCGRLTAEELKAAIERYGKTVINVPADAWEEADIFPVDAGGLSIDLPLWTLEEGRSDLTLSVSVERSSDGEALVSIDDLHVL